MDEIDALSKRFKNYIDKVQAAFDKANSQKPDAPKGRDGLIEKPVKLYTVVSPVEDMASNLKSVLSAIDNAIDNIDKLSQNVNDEKDDRQKGKTSIGKGTEAYIPEPGQKKFTAEELDFLVRTFNKILSTPKKEREQLFKQFEKNDSPENGS
jgi:tRNA/tmRNA/rRNA uracil-C5-methylase (TrmA/RlmC/RlmD family)